MRADSTKAAVRLQRAGAAAQPGLRVILVPAQGILVRVLVELVSKVDGPGPPARVHEAPERVSSVVRVCAEDGIFAGYAVQRLAGAYPGP